MRSQSVLVVNLAIMTAGFDRPSRRSHRSGTLGEMAKDARTHDRHHIPARADVFGEHVALHLPLSDLSMGGCQTRGTPTEVEGAAVTLMLQFSTDDSSLALAGEVVRVDEDAMGIQFVDLQDEQKWAVRKQIRANTQALKRR